MPSGVPGCERILVGMAKSFAVLGSPIEHSKSPAIHLAAYRELGLDWSYSKVQVEAAELAGFLQNSNLAGCSLTMPLKDRAFALANCQDEAAIKASAANTLVRAGETWLGYNTDVFGLSKALENISCDSVAIIGSGATARNAVIAVQQLNPQAALQVLARSESAGNALVGFARVLGLNATFAPTPLNVTSVDLVISTVPAAADVSDWLIGIPKSTLLDVAYSPWPSRLATLWTAGGGNVVSGIEMLVWQAIAQIRVFLNGNVAEPLPNEPLLAQLMRAAAAE